MQKFNSWGVSFSTIRFFEEGLESHNKIKSISRDSDILFTIDTVFNATYKVLLLNEYVMGEASVIKALGEFGKLDFIVYGGKWNDSTEEANRIASENNIRLFDISDFLGAINLKNPKEYNPNAKKKSSITSCKHA